MHKNVSFFFFSTFKHVRCHLWCKGTFYKCAVKSVTEKQNMGKYSQRAVNTFKKA